MLEGDERDLFVLYAIPIRSFVSVMSYMCFQIVAIARYFESEDLSINITSLYSRRSIAGRQDPADRSQGTSA
jgi:hypothetical protein